MAAAAAAIVMAPAAAMMAMAATERAEATAKSAEEEELGGELGIVLAYPAYSCFQVRYEARTRRASPCCCRRANGRSLPWSAVEEALS